MIFQDIYRISHSSLYYMLGITWCRVLYGKCLPSFTFSESYFRSFLASEITTKYVKLERYLSYWLSLSLNNTKLHHIRQLVNRMFLVMRQSLDKFLLVIGNCSWVIRQLNIIVFYRHIVQYWEGNTQSAERELLRCF